MKIVESPVADARPVMYWHYVAPLWMKKSCVPIVFGSVVAVKGFWTWNWREQSVGEPFLGSGSAGGDAVCADSAQHSTERSSLDRPPWNSGVGFFQAGDVLQQFVEVGHADQIPADHLV